MEAKDYIQRMYEISLKKLQWVEEILLFARSEKEALVSNRTDELETLINEKQMRMDAVDKLDEQFVVYSSRLKSSLSLKSLEDLPSHNLSGVKELKEVVGSIHQRLGEIKMLEDENITLAKAELEETKLKMDQSKTFKRVQGAYNPVNANTSSYFFDKKK